MAWPEPDERVTGDARARRVDRGCAGAGLAGFAIAVLVVLVAGGLALRGCDLSIGPFTGSRTGDRSQHLPVQVAPTTGLDDGTTVLLTSRAFAADTVVGVLQCLREADSRHRGIEACDQTTLVRFATDPAGVLAQPVAVRRVIRVDGVAHDCAGRAGRCLLVAASSGDHDRSGGQPLSFRAGLGPPELTRVVAPPVGGDLPVEPARDGPYRVGSSVEVTATGFRPGEPLLLARCRTPFVPGDLGDAADDCDPIGDDSSVLLVALGSLDGGLPRADDQGRFSGTVTVARKLHPYSGGTVDCTTATGRCAIVVAAAADAHRSAVLPYEIAAG